MPRLCNICIRPAKVDFGIYVRYFYGNRRNYLFYDINFGNVLLTREHMPKVPGFRYGFH